MNTPIELNGLNHQIDDPGKGVNNISKPPYKNLNIILPKIKEAQKNGESHRNILLAFNNDDREQAGVYLSAQVDTDLASSNRTANFFVLLLLALFFILELISFFMQTGWKAAIMPAGILLLFYMVHKKNAWGYNGVLLYVGWNLIGLVREFIVVAQLEPEDEFLLIIIVPLVILLGSITWYLRKQLFPYMGILGPRYDYSGKLSILEIVEKPDNSHT